MKYILRFAPSPTGYLHVGGARTAIFNWLMARHHNGRFLLRIEDTDKARSTKEAVDQIIESLNWLGVHWDGDIWYQSSRLSRHQEVARELLNSGQAYRCFCTREELEEKRKTAEREKRNKRYDGTCRHLSEEQIRKNLNQNKPFSIRLKIAVPEVAFEDQIHGQQSSSTADMDDFIILRPDGSPVYQLAVVCDDHDMEVTHIIRGDDHLPNTPKQILIYRAMNWTLPKFAHIPLILGPDKRPLSKRHGAASVEEFRREGILPEAMFNYLSLLGWSPGDDREVMVREEIIRAFSLERVNKSAAVFDPKKLLWLNGQYIMNLSADELLREADTWLEQNGYKLQEAERRRFTYLIGLQQKRSRTLNALWDALHVFFRAPREYDEKGVRKFFGQNNASIVLNDLLEAFKDFDQSFYDSPERIEQFIRGYAEKQGISAAKVIHPLRLALTGKTESPGIFEMIYILGKEKVTQRLENALQLIQNITETSVL
ncbi:MAG TPA: glutamate--tRNA ligase [Caldithrix abyssi]|uniref:Glutamate--tRNA ligase n=1 Tax=Caldithrix abyssi TaxID=187145 RepID=A0A7V4U205_CALAY|nr:glutamate--tRNA ligase [Caldithrix abyssi]